MDAAAAGGDGDKFSAVGCMPDVSYPSLYRNPAFRTQRFLRGLGLDTSG